jgi:hypothetical protein
MENNDISSNEVKLDETPNNISEGNTNKLELSGFDSNENNQKIDLNPEKEVIEKEVTIKDKISEKIKFPDLNSKITNNEVIVHHTLNESILTSLLRDLLKILFKIKFVLNPFSKNDILNKEILDWDLWGPLIFTILLSFCQSSIHKQNQFMLIFFIFWIGSFVIYLNGRFLGSKLSFYCFACLLGYSLVPFIIVSLPMVIFKFHRVLKFLFSLFAVCWSSYVSFGFIKNKVNINKIFLMVYPIGMLYFFFFVELLS